MPNPVEIGIIDLHFTPTEKVILTVMLNQSDKDYATLDELYESKELTDYSTEAIFMAVNNLLHRKFLITVEKPYGCVYALNKLTASNIIEYIYG